MERHGTSPGPDGEDPREVSMDWRDGDGARRSAWPMSVALAAVVAVAAAGIAFASARGASDTEPDAEEAAEVVDDRSDDDADRRTPLIDTVNPMGPRDGLDSKRHPVSVSPADQLIDGQQVTVSGSSFPPDTALGVVMCSGMVDLGGGAAQCQLAPYTPVTSDADGNFETTYPVRRLVVIGGEEIDCAAPTPDGLDATCVVAVGALNDYDESGIAPVHFDASIPAPPPPTLAVAPATDLVDGQVLEVTVTGIDDEVWWWPMLCADLDGEEWCEQLLPGPQNPEMSHQHGGPGTLEVTVQRMVAEFAGQAGIDCAEALGRCWIRVWAGPRPVEPVLLGFDPAGPIPEPRPHPTVVADPRPPLTVAPDIIEDEVPTETTVG